MAARPYAGPSIVPPLSARWHDDLRVFYQRLRAHGKPAKVALVAVARKLLLILNALLKEAHPSFA